MVLLHFPVSAEIQTELVIKLSGTVNGVVRVRVVENIDVNKIWR